MDLRIDNGPWETIFSGKAFGHDFEIVQNIENFFLTIIYDSQGTRRVGALVEGKKAFVAKGSMESFIQTLPKSCMGIAKTQGNTTSKIFFLSFDPIYLDFREEDFVRKLDGQVQRIYEMSSTMGDLARASSLDLKEVAMSSQDDYASILGDPFASRLFMSGSSSAGSMSKLDLAMGGSNEKEQLIQLGLGKSREIIREKSSDLYRTIVAGEKKDMLEAMHVLAENFMLENKPIIVFDAHDYFDALANPSKEETALKDALVEFEPVGFPMKQFFAKENIKIALCDTDLVFLFEMLGAGDIELERSVALLNLTTRSKTPRELIEKVLASTEISEFGKLKAERLLNIVDMHFSKMFGPPTDVSELTKKWPGSLGRITVLDTKDLTAEEKLIFMQTVMRMISKSIRDKASNEFVVFVPEADEMLSADEEKITNTILRLESVGVGLVLGTKGKLREDLAKTLTATISVVNGRDVAISIKNKRNYRVILRPNLSS